MKFSFLVTTLLLLNTSVTFSQAASYTDPAAGYLRVMLEKGSEGTYQQIGTFKVKGTSYLFGEKLKGGIFTKTEKSEHVELGYNTYSQTVDVNLNGVQSIEKKVSEVDSFIIYNNNSAFLKKDLLFYSSKLITPKAKDGFYQVISTGPKFNVYKGYTASLEIVSTNYIQSDLRQFSLDYNFYYTDNKTKELKKIKISKKKLVDEFKNVMDVSIFLDEDEMEKNPELALIKVFNALNN
jgi:predicted RNA-binding protein with PUA domain